MKSKSGENVFRSPRFFVSEKLLSEAGSVPRMNYFGTFSAEHARSKSQRITFAPFIYKGGQRYSQEEKKSVAFATETQRLRENALKDFCDFRIDEIDQVTRIDSAWNTFNGFALGIMPIVR
ncbi:MAG: hypothetical protein ACRD40_17295 [Candidatus Acidiferrales bacterium]